MSAFGKFSIQTPYKRVHGLGSAGAGTEHFWRQRITAVALIPLTLVFVVVVILATGKDYDAARRLLGGGGDLRARAGVRLHADRRGQGVQRRRRLHRGRRLRRRGALRP